MTDLPIYFDYMATTPVDPLVIEKMVHYMGPDSHFGNAASNTHAYGKIAASAVDEARCQIAQLIHANPHEIVFTSGATESDNLAIIGGARFYKRKGRHIITMGTEHKAVLDSCMQLEKEGFELTYLKPEANGMLSLDVLKEALRDDTILVSIMHANNEIGVIQDIYTIGEYLHDKGIVFHVDAAQSAGKVPIDVRELRVSMMSFSAHKIYGPKGIGALYVRKKPRVRLEPLMFGGGHEGGMRSGTLATHQIVGMGAAFELANTLLDNEHERILSLRQKLWKGIKALPGIHLNGDEHKRVAGNLNISFDGIDGESLLLALRDLAISTSSACSSASIEPSYVLKALGLPDALAHSSVRISLGRFTKEQEIDKAIGIITKQISRLREISPI
jgi:cysteine desulfurase